ncbi:hypothetical protein HK100_009829 [Physocladia obscura]|uniref:Uncharacterized protein n=1 Tax=Physocladia obscura TaxID=109957 RepID=A0AAD5XE20_9FUNG|nr:hypothetical protein HK100_009829 [Physocladia obscura]
MVGWTAASRRREDNANSGSNLGQLGSSDTMNGGGLLADINSELSGNSSLARHADQNSYSANNPQSAHPLPPIKPVEPLGISWVLSGEFADYNSSPITDSPNEATQMPRAQDQPPTISTGQLPAKQSPARESKNYFGSFGSVRNDTNSSSNKLVDLNPFLKKKDASLPRPSPRSETPAIIASTPLSPVNAVFDDEKRQYQQEQPISGAVLVGMLAAFRNSRNSSPDPRPSSPVISERRMSFGFNSGRSKSSISKHDVSETNGRLIRDQLLESNREIGSPVEYYDSAPMERSESSRSVLERTKTWWQNRMSRGKSLPAGWLKISRPSSPKNSRPNSPKSPQPTSPVTPTNLEYPNTLLGSSSKAISKTFSPLSPLNKKKANSKQENLPKDSTEKLAHSVKIVGEMSTSPYNPNQEFKNGSPKLASRSSTKSMASRVSALWGKHSTAPQSVTQLVTEKQKPLELNESRPLNISSFPDESRNVFPTSPLPKSPIPTSPFPEQGISEIKMKFPPQKSTLITSYFQETNRDVTSSNQFLNPDSPLIGPYIPTHEEQLLKNGFSAWYIYGDSASIASVTKKESMLASQERNNSPFIEESVPISPQTSINQRSIDVTPSFQVEQQNVDKQISATVLSRDFPPDETNAAEKGAAAELSDATISVSTLDVPAIVSDIILEPSIQLNKLENNSRRSSAYFQVVTSENNIGLQNAVQLAENLEEAEVLTAMEQEGAVAEKEDKKEIAEEQNVPVSELKELFQAVVDVGDVSLDWLIENLGKENCDIAVLDLSDDHLNGQDVVLIAQVLKINKSLKILMFGDSQVSEIARVALESSFRFNTTLNEVKIGTQSFIRKNDGTMPSLELDPGNFAPQIFISVAAPIEVVNSEEVYVKKIVDSNINHVSAAAFSPNSVADQSVNTEKSENNDSGLTVGLESLISAEPAIVEPLIGGKKELTLPGIDRANIKSVSFAPEFSDQAIISNVENLEYTPFTGPPAVPGLPVPAGQNLTPEQAKLYQQQMALYNQQMQMYQKFWQQHSMSHGQGSPNYQSPSNKGTSSRSKRMSSYSISESDSGSYNGSNYGGSSLLPANSSAADIWNKVFLMRPSFKNTRRSSWTTSTRTEVALKVNTLRLGLEKAASKPDSRRSVNAMVEFAKFCIQNTVALDPAERHELLTVSFDILKKLCFRGVAEAQYLLGKAYLDDGNYDSSYILLYNAAIQSYGPACGKISTLIAGGKGVERSEANAVSFLKRGVAAGDVESAYKLGYAYSYGKLGLRSSFSEAVKLFNECAKDVKSDYRPKALFEISKIFEVGSNEVSKNESVALSALNDSAKSGYLPAITRIADCYLHGKFGLRADADKAKSLFKTAAELGDEQARAALLSLRY